MTATPIPENPRIPWYIWLAALAVTSAIVGIQWDISWHRSIGRDAFLTPAHIAIYLCGILSGLYCAYLIFSATFGHGPARAASVHVWGLRGPLGAFIAAWGGFAMLTSAPFDDWWHNAYGLDVKILSPPHVVLALGIFAIQAGVVLLVASQRNRASEKTRERLEWLFLYVGGMGLLLLMSLTLEYSSLVLQHNAVCYQALCVGVPATLAIMSQPSRNRFPATTVAAIYMLFMLGLLWILPLFPAEPKLGPVYHQVTHFVPAGFPILLIFPALALDLFWGKFPAMNPWKKALISGPLFLLILLAVQWPFADFLFSPASRNAFFGGDEFDYLTRPNSLAARHVFLGNAGAREFWIGIAWALLWSVLSFRVGFSRARGLSQVQR